MCNNSDEEHWKIVPECPNYAVSCQGRVRRATVGPGTWPGRIKKPTINFYGYLVVNLVTNGKPKVFILHRLICQVFRGPPPDKRYEAAHEDGNRTNAKLENIKWKLPHENNADKHRHGTFLMAEKHWKGVLTDDDVRAIRRSEESSEDLSKRYGVSAHWIYIVRTYRGRKFVERE